MTDLAVSTPPAAQLRARLVESLLADGAITTAAVEAAFRAVPREAFAPPGTDLATVYADDVVITKRRPDGQATSSVSAPWLSLSTAIVLRRRFGKGRSQHQGSSCSRVSAGYGPSYFDLKKQIDDRRRVLS